MRILIPVFFLIAACAHSGAHRHHGKRHRHGGGRNEAGNPASARAFDRYVRALDRKGRSKWQKPKVVLGALKLAPGQAVADIGAGTGYFTFRLAREVGPGGRVYGVDVDDRFLELLKHRKKRFGMGQVKLVKAGYDDPSLPPSSIDLAFICNTYHHIKSRVGWLRKLAVALKPGGRVVNVDFHKRKLPVGPPLNHKLSAKEVSAEFARAGYRLVEKRQILPYQYILIYTPGQK